MITVLERAICFEKQEQYNALVADISKVSLKYHEALNHGLMFQIHMDSYSYGSDNSYILRFRLKRDKNAYNLVVGKEELRLKQSGRLIEWSHLGKNRGIYMQDFETEGKNRVVFQG